MEALEAEAEEADAVPAFLQIAEKKNGFLSRTTPKDGRQVVMELLKSKGAQLKSTLLTSLVSHVAEDPFAKIKVLIQELIERLLKEAANESTQKGWCDKATKDATQKKDYAAEQVDELNSEMATLEALRDKLTEEISVLGDEISELKDKRAEAESLRADEKAENAHTVSEAEAGLEAVLQATDILKKFYATVAKETVEFAQQSPADDAPDAGFKNFESYNGAQSEAGGIVGMLEVIQSDFERTISETEKSEAQAEQDHLKFMTETGVSLAEKETAEEQKTAENEAAKEKLSDADENLKSQMEILTGAVQELLDLKPVCVDTGMSYEDRVARREDEIAALKKADCILGAYAE
jgi:chromosome segregation ATPase